MIRVEKLLRESRADSLADLCLRLTRETFSPATVLINRSLDCLYCSGPSERFLHVPEGPPNHNLLAMMQEDPRTILRPALQRAWHENRRLTVDAGQSLRDGILVSLRIHLLPVHHAGEDLMLVCFAEGPEAHAEARILPLLLEIPAATPVQLPVNPLLPVKPVLLRPPTAIALNRPLIFIIDADGSARSALRGFLEREGHLVEDFVSCEAYLADRRLDLEGCLLIDLDLRGMTALQLLTHLSEAGRSLPTIMMSSNSTVPMAVQAMRSGAIDFLSKPLHQAELLASLRRALEKSQEDSKISAGREDAASRIAGLTRRQSQIMKLILAGQPNKNIAVDLDISQRTVEHHRALIMEKTGTTSLPDLARLALAAIKSKT